MSSFELSQYQKDILNFIQENNSNLLIDAKAGSGKTSTLVEINKVLQQQDKKCLVLSFTRNIVEELEHKFNSPNCTVKTIYGLGLSFIRSYLYRKHGKNYNLEIDEHKIHNLCNSYYEKYIFDKISEYKKFADKKEERLYHKKLIQEFTSLCNMVRVYNLNLKNPDMDNKIFDMDRFFRNKIIKRFCTTIFDVLDEALSLEDCREYVTKVINASYILFENPVLENNGTYVYTIDYVDMIDLPVHYRMSTPKSYLEYTDTVLVDECVPSYHYIDTNKGKISFKELKRRFDNEEQILVKSYNDATKLFEYKDIINIVDKGERDIYEITVYITGSRTRRGTLPTAQIQGTANHKFLTNNGWKYLSDIGVNDKMLTTDNITGKIYETKIKSIEHRGKASVMDMEVAGNHNFIVSKHYSDIEQASFIAHNCQDLSKLQQEFVKLMNTGTNRFIFVGDAYQCQPGGTKVLMADLSVKNIENVKSGDYVMSYNMKFNDFKKSTVRYTNNKVLDVQKLQAEGYYSVTLDNGNQSNYTYNHKCYARFNTNIGYITYIIGTKEGKFMVGYTNLFSNNDSKIHDFGLKIKMNQENCTFGWIINYYKNRDEASAEVQLISSKYQIPQTILNNTDINRQRVKACIEDYGRSTDYPFVIAKDSKHDISENHLVIYETCNLIPEIMECAYYNSDKQKQGEYNNSTDNILYSKIKTIKFIKNRCDVYCLKVDGDENYFGDNILTHNCIYGFNGADSHSIDNIKRVFNTKMLPLNICYRCPENVVRIARSIVSDIEWNPTRTDAGNVTILDLKKALKTMGSNDVCMARYNKDLVSIYKYSLLDLNVLIKFRQDKLITTIVREIKDCVSKYINFYNKGLNVDKDVYNYLEHFQKVTRCIRSDSLYKREVNLILPTLVQNRLASHTDICKSNFNISYLETCIAEYIEYGEYAFDSEDKDLELAGYTSVIQDLIQQYKENKSSVLVEDFIEYVKQFLSKTQYTDAPQLCTVHAMKGAEADNIFIYNYPLYPYKFSNQSAEDFQQEKNIQYVAITRAKKNIYFITMPKSIKGSANKNAESILTISNLVKSTKICT